MRTLVFVLTFLCVCSAKAQVTDPLVNTFLDSARHFEKLNKNLQAYRYTERAYGKLLTLPGKNEEKLGSLQSDMGTYAHRMGNIKLSEIHHRNALQIFQKSGNRNNEYIYLSGNNMGSIMWFSSKIDSALYYFNIALDALSKLEPTPQNRYYRPAVLHNNLAAIYGVQGKTTEAIAAMKSTIRNIRQYLDLKTEVPKREQAVQMQFEATDNLAGIYKELGNYRQALQLLTHSYHEKIKALGKDNADVFKSEVLLGQLYHAMKEHEKAVIFLDSSIMHLQDADGDLLFWQADAYNTLALLHDDKKQHQQATAYYEKADQLYEQSLQGDYDNIYLEFLNNAALYYAEKGDSARALSKAAKGYHYIIKTQGLETLSGFHQLINLSAIHFELGNFSQSLRYSSNGLRVIGKLTASGGNLLDSVKIQLKKPKALLLMAKSEYALLTEKKKETLMPILNRLREGLSILDKRRSYIMDAEDIHLLMSEHTDLLDFTKKISLELYHITGDETFADALINLHETGLYNRIRSRLDKSDSLQFAQVPATIMQEEKKLKKALTDLDQGKPHGENIRRYIKAQEEWEIFLKKIRNEYPGYYQMRYATVFRPINEIPSMLADGTTLIRYFFVDEELLALVADNTQRTLVTLDTTHIKGQITLLASGTADEAATAGLLHGLYNKLWKPLSAHIHNRKIVIVPDGILYNLNFETLTPRKITGYDQLATGSLLADHFISYAYSLFLLNPNETGLTPDKQFVGFVPGFMDENKEAYKHTAIPDEQDNSYLSLLPQPFMMDLVRKAANMFSGNVFTDQESTIESFRKHAGRHKIIHIGTHAESDNLNPEYSRLVFAKGPTGSPADNSLYLFDIYNCDLTSDLTVITACESGKAGYQDGEGMISLSHAFNYSGSKSILTSLWKIDEQSSAMIMEDCYAMLRKGLPKDEALQRAKLAYLKKAHGRALAPQYWAGLVIMGDTTPIKFETTNTAYYLLLFLALILMVSAAIYIYKIARK